MNRFAALVLLPAVVLGAAGCGTSTPARHYTLPPAAADDGSGPEVPVTAAARPFTLLVAPVAVAAYLDRPQMAVRMADGRLALREFDRWAEPLDEGLTRQLAAELARLMPASRVVELPFPGGSAEDLRLATRVTRFEADEGGTARLDVQWTVTDGRGRAVVAPRRERYSREGASTEPAAMLEALSFTVADLARSIAEALASVQ